MDLVKIAVRIASDQREEDEDTREADVELEDTERDEKTGGVWETLMST
jgi:hypothetical protein